MYDIPFLLHTHYTKDNTMDTDYRAEVISDAKDTAENFLDEILLHILDKGKASDDLFNDYSGGDSYHHESHVDKYYDLNEAADVLDELRDDEETDSGLWEGKDPREAISIQAAFTYGNAVYSRWRKLIEEINEAVEDFVLSYEDDDGVTVSEECKARLKKLVEDTIKRS